MPPGFERSSISGFIPVQATIEYGLSRHLGIAALAGYDAYTNNINQLYSDKGRIAKRYKADGVRTVSAGALLYYHLTGLFRTNRWDPFIGTGVVLNNTRHSAQPMGDSTAIQLSHNAKFMLRGGLRCYVTRKWSLYADAGYGNASIVNVSVSARLGRKKVCVVPDADNDGVPDSADQCMWQAGPVWLNGCPDADGDSVADKDDACPTLAGLVALHGCPDSDGDGIADKDDACPTVRGTAAFHGCPDTDGDGIADAADHCPDVAGLARFNGCPDTDGDGVPDNEDKCPTIAGLMLLSGCPDAAKPVHEQLKVDKIQFATGTSRLTPKSYEALAAVVTTMQADTTTTLYVHGYADATGTAAINKRISLQRALVVKHYMVAKGMPTSRIVAIGHGSNSPIATNKTARGRAMNRRVAMKMKYKE
jgi:outer membrane protein OmpA-like peptidoglycan-associated protein